MQARRYPLVLRGCLNKEWISMQIAQVAPLAEAVPPGLYGGTERVVSWLTEELVKQGHQVTLSRVAILKPQPISYRAFPEGCGWRGFAITRPAPWSCSIKSIAVQTNSTLSIFISTFCNFPIFQDLFQKCVTTLHGRPDLPDFIRSTDFFRTCRLCPSGTISAARCRPH